MRDGKRGFTLLEILIVMIVVGIMLPVIGAAFYMLLSVPPRETGKLTTINDVALALNWIRDDAMRAQFYSGSPSYLEATKKYDFSMCAHGTECTAWEKLHAPTDPTDQGTEAGFQDYNDIEQRDSAWWETDLTGDNDGWFNTQMYHFALDEAPEEMLRLSASWVGHGEAQGGYETSAWVWDFVAGTWDNIGLATGVGTDTSWSAQLDPDDHLSATGDVYIMAKAEHYYDSGGNSCPFIFGWNGTGYEFIDVSFPDVFLKRYETTTHQVTRCLEAVDGHYEVVFHQSLPETGYINNLGLWVVDHPEGTEAMVEQSMVMSPQRSGIIHTVRDPQPVTAVDRDGRDVTGLLASRDGEYWESELEGKDFSDVDDLYDWVTVTLPERPEEGTAKLVIDAGESMLGKFQLWYCSQYLLGTPNLDFFYNRLETDEDFYKYFDLTVWLSSAFTVQYRDGSEWVDYTDIGFVDFLGRPRVVLLDMARIEGNQVRLHTPIGLREIDYVAVDYSPDEPVTVTELQPAEVTQHFVNGSTADAAGAVAAADGDYAVLEQGEHLTCRYAAPEPPAEGYTRTFVIPTGGYYYVRGPEVPFDWLDRLPLAEEVTYVPYAYSKWTLPRYANPDEYEWRQYYPVSYGHFTPRFPLKRENSLHGNYVSVLVVIPQMPGETEGGNETVLGSFSWVDRTGNKSRSYTIHYIHDESTGRLLREEWIDNSLNSTVSAGKHIVNFEDISFDYYPHGEAGSGEPFIEVSMLANMGEGTSVQYAQATERYVMRGEGMSHGFAVLARYGDGYPLVLNDGTSGVTIDGDLYSHRSAYLGGVFSITGTVYAAGQINDPSGQLDDSQKERFWALRLGDWPLSVSDFLDPGDPAEREFIFSGDVLLSEDDNPGLLCNGEPCWEADSTLRTGVYYTPDGTITLNQSEAQGMVTIVGEKVVVNAEGVDLVALSNGVLLYGTDGTCDRLDVPPKQTIKVSNSGAQFSGSLYAPCGEINITASELTMYGSCAAQKFYFEGTGGTISY